MRVGADSVKGRVSEGTWDRGGERDRGPGTYKGQFRGRAKGRTRGRTKGPGPGTGGVEHGQE